MSSSITNSSFGNNSTSTSIANNVPTSTIILIIVSSIICVSGFIGNMTIAAIILRCKKMQTATNWFVFNLAVCDLVIVVVTIPFNLIHQFINWPFGSIGCKYLVMPLMEHFACVCVLTHTAISLVRYTIISRGGIRGIISVKFSRIVICLIWFISIMVLSAPLMGFLGKFDLEVHNKTVVCKLTWLTIKKQKIYRVGVFIITYLFPMVTTGYSYYKIHFLVVSSLRNVNSLLTKNMLQKRRRKARQMDSTLMRMYAMFAVITLPLQLFMFLLDFDLIPRDNGANLRLTFDLLMNLFYTQILSNPLVLLYMGDEYRKQMRHLKLCCCFFVPRIRKLSQKLEGSFRNMYSSRHYSRRATEFTDMSITENFNERSMRSTRSSRSLKYSFSRSSPSLRRRGIEIYDKDRIAGYDYSCLCFKRRPKNNSSRADSNRLTNIFFEHTKMLTSAIECDIVRLNQTNNNRVESLDDEKKKKFKMLCVIYETSCGENEFVSTDSKNDRETIL